MKISSFFIFQNNLKYLWNFLKSRKIIFCIALIPNYKLNKAWTTVVVLSSYTYLKYLLEMKAGDTVCIVFIVKMKARMAVIFCGPCKSVFPARLYRKDPSAFS